MKVFLLIIYFFIINMYAQDIKQKYKNNEDKKFNEPPPYVEKNKYNIKIWETSEIQEDKSWSREEITEEDAFMKKKEKEKKFGFSFKIE